MGPRRWLPIAAATLCLGTGAAAITGLATSGGASCPYSSPADAGVVYHGRYVPMQGIPMSRAYQSTLTISRTIIADCTAH